jgi:parallel beta-helix repeat protein
MITGNKVTNTRDGYGFYDDYNPNATYANNTAQGNYYGGFYFADDQSSDTITGNVSKGAQDGDGFYFEYSYSYYNPLVLSKNTGSNNSDYGFYGDEYVVPGNNNTAVGNGSGNCYYVAGC